VVRTDCSAEWPCGSSTEGTRCYLNVGRDVNDSSQTECAVACDNSTDYVENEGKGRCVLRDCTARAEDGTFAAWCFAVCLGASVVEVWQVECGRWVGGAGRVGAWVEWDEWAGGCVSGWGGVGLHAMG
jgi:hypothetical protein